LKKAATIGLIIVSEFQSMPKARRTRAIAIAKADDRAKLFRFSMLMIAAGTTAALLAVPVLF
jgi:hypothetical protein